MPRPPTTISDFIALPIVLQTAILPPTTHYIYLHPYTPKHPSPDSPRSLFLVNIPINTTDSHLKHLLTTQLDGGRIERIHFARDNDDGTDLIANPPASALSEDNLNLEKSNSNSKKRKRPAEQIPILEQRLSEIKMPSTAPSPIHRTGSSAVVVFLDRTSRDLTLRNAKRHAQAVSKKAGKAVVWGEGMPDPPPMGVARYKAMKDLIYPDVGDLMVLANEYMGVYGELEEARSKENARKRAVVDEDGFVTVTKGSRGGVSAEEVKRREAETKVKKRKSDGLEDFYRFQMRDRRRDAGEDLRRRFGEDRRRVREMMDRRGSG